MTIIRGLAVRRSAVVRPLANDRAVMDGFSESLHPRGQPANAGQFASSGATAHPAQKGGGKEIPPPTGEHELESFIASVKASPEYRKVESQLEALQKQTKSGDVRRWSMEKNQDEGGEYTAERKALHDKIVASVLTPETVAKPGKRPQAVLLLGPPGSGKTTAGVPVAREMVGHDTRLANLNADDVKEAMPEYQGHNAAAVHEESSELVEGRIVPEGIEGRHNMMFDFTGNSAPKMMRIAEMLKDKGYDVHVVNVKVPTYVAVSRAWKRFTSSGRFVPPDYVKEVDGNPERTYTELQKNPAVKSWAEVDNGPDRSVKRGGK